MITFPTEDSANISFDLVRVLLKTENYESIYHAGVKLYSEEGMKLTFMGEEESNGAIREEKEYTITGEDFGPQIREICVEPISAKSGIVISNLTRSQGKPEYPGRLILKQGEDGILIINELSMEDYLYRVVPSEMPSGYPLEALKAQAVCARTYAARHIVSPGYPNYNAHLDDSTSFQVYNNTKISLETNRAVDDTRGLLLYVGDELADTYYYSTSCGVGSDCLVWKNKENYNPSYLRARFITDAELSSKAEIYFDNDTFEAFIQNRNENDFEKNQGWYRWQFYSNKVSVDGLLKRIQERYEETPKLILTKKGDVYQSQPIKSLGKLKNITVSKRGSGGVADELVIEGTKATIKVITEYNIRKVLAAEDGYVVTQEGKHIENMGMLPSAFFSLETEKEKGNIISYHLYGGGFGHGVGMSQNAACEMAKAGMKMDEILKFFYDGCEIHD